MTFSRLFEMGTFSVPWHQRYYDWEKGHVTELLKDIDEACLEQRACYFLGSIMLIEAEGDHWEINDGQQRMITVSLIIAWLCRLASDENPDHQRVKTALDKLFVLPPDEVCSLNDADRYRPRIDPPRHNRSQYHQLICGQSIGTNGKLTSAWVEIQTFLAHKSPSDAYRYFDYLVQNTEVAVLRVPEKVDANSVYETLNYRGKKLDAVDLIRNHLYSFFSKDRDQPRRQTVHEGLERIGKTLSRRGKSKSRSAEEFVRCYAQCLFGFLHSQNFYRDFRRKLRAHLDRTKRTGTSEGDAVFRLVGRLTDPAALELFRLIGAPRPDPAPIAEFERATKTTRKRRNFSVFLRELRNYTVVQPLLFAMLMVYARESDKRRGRKIANEIHRSLSRLSTLVLRTSFAAPKFEPSHYEERFATFAYRITMENRIPEADFTALLRERDHFGILDDERFRESMRQPKLTGNVRIRNFLLGVNSDTSLLNEERCSIEHILPKGREYWSGWRGFSTVDPDGYVQRLGNLTLMGPEDNRPGGRFNGNFGAKKGIYGESAVTITRRVAAAKDWGPKEIEARERDLVRRAIRVWTFEG